MEENNNVQVNEETSAEPQTQNKTLDIKSIVVLIVAAIVIFLFLKSCVFGGGVDDDLYIGCAKEVISNDLKNPSSLVINEAYVVEEDDYNSAIVYMDYNASNSFGGLVRSRAYVCVRYVQPDGEFKYSTHFSYVEIDYENDTASLEALKELNDFGQPKEE